MTGKDFFGKLLTNREEDEAPPWDRSTSSSPPAEEFSGDSSVDGDGEHPPSADRSAPERASSYVEQPIADLSSNPPTADGAQTRERTSRWFYENDAQEPMRAAPETERPETHQPASATDRPTSDADGLDELETTYDPSVDGRPHFGTPGGDGLSTQVPDVGPPPERSTQAAPTEAAPVDDLPREVPAASEPLAQPVDSESPAPSLADTFNDDSAAATPADAVPGDTVVDNAPTLEDQADDAPAREDQLNNGPVREDQLDNGPVRENPVDDEPIGAAGDAASPAAPPSADAEVAESEGVAGIRDRVVLRLLDKRIVTAEQVKKALANRDKAGLKATLWRILAQDPTVNRAQVYREAALTYAFVERSLEDDGIDLEFVRQVADVFPEKKRNRLIELRIVPVGYEFEQQTQMLRVVFITHDPSLPAVRELMQDLNLERYELQYADEDKVKDLLSRAFPKKNEYLERMSDDPLAYDLGTSYEDEKSELIDEEALEAEINRSSLINLFEAALVEAVHRGASDIHIYPNARRQIEIHFRVDGRLSLWHLEDKVHPESLLAVIKDNTMNVDRFERDMAQDGFIQRKVDEALIRYRVSILPIATASNNLHAESIVIRVLDDRKVITDLSKLGLLTGALERFDMAIRQPHGMVILTGPTGSGKSTTLVAALHQVVTPEVNVLTVEDPVEYIIPDVRQIKLNHKLGLEGAIRAILRHDPDVVMVGEMRDRATAELAVKLANTGHLTFSTLHTNDAPSAVSRLYKMGVEPFLIAYAINLVVAQRLMRNLCPTCKVVDNDPDPVLLKRLGFTDEDLTEHAIYKASGDPTCKTCKGMGYKGRRAISEAMYFSREIRHMIVEANQRIDEDGLREQARSEGMLSLQDSAREVVKMGETSVDEMMRVTMTEE